jgi:hypothetical protein
MRYFLPKFCLAFGLFIGQSCAILLVMQGVSYAQTTLESIPLRYQNAQSVIDQLQPKLKAGEYAVVSGNTILLNAQTTELAQYRALIATLDSPIKRWLLEMRQGNLALLQKEAGIEGDVTISNRGANGVVMIGNASSEAQNRTISQSLQVQEGMKAPISLGNVKPLVLRTTVARTDGSLGISASALQVPEQSGLWAALYQHDERSVILELAPRNASINELIPNHTSALLNMPLGQWTTLAETANPEPEASPRAATTKASSPYVVQARLTVLP